MSAIGTSGFSCEGKVIGGYYADIASGCQMFHVCTLGQEGWSTHFSNSIDSNQFHFNFQFETRRETTKKRNHSQGEIRDIKFLCLAGTVFDQETRVCLLGRPWFIQCRHLVRNRQKKLITQC